MKPLTYKVFISYKRKTGEDFALHLKDGLEAEGIHAFLDIQDIPKILKEQIEWWKHRDNALANSEVFLLLLRMELKPHERLARKSRLQERAK